MKIILADPPFAGKKTEQAQISPNLGLLYLISALRQKIDGLQIHYLEGFHNLKSHLKEVEQIGPDLYCLSFATTYAPLSYQLINTIKERYPSLPVVCGGAHPSANPDDVINNSRADVCCLGEGEETIVALVQSYMSGNDLSTVAGIVYRKDEEVLRTALRPVIKDLDTIPHPAWDIIDFHNYLGNRKYKGSPSTAIVASRGCPFDCTFCSNPVWKLQKPWVRLRSPQDIAHEVDYLYNRGIREIYLRSDEMNPNHKWCIEVFKALSELGHRDLYFQCNLKAKPITEELAEALSEANCWMIHLGIESANQRVLNGIKKNISVEDILKACRILKKYNIKIFGFLMMYQAWEEDDELCVELPQEVDNTLRFAWKLRIQKLIDNMSWAFAVPYPNSELYRVVNKYNLMVPLLKSRQLESIQDIPMNLPGISKRQMAMSRTKGLMLQGLFVLSSEGFFRRRNFWANVKRAGMKMKYVASVNG